jgi:phenol 2-monooxygenase (NADPH)
VVFHQGRIERFFLNSIESWSDIRNERGVMPTSLKLNEHELDDPDAYPITVALQHLSEKEATPKQDSTSANGAALQDGLFRSNLTPEDTKELLGLLNPTAKQKPRKWSMRNTCLELTVLTRG